MSPSPPEAPLDSRPRPLIATDDPRLLDDLLRLASAASVEVDLARTVDRAMRLWARAPLAVVGTDLSSALRTADPPPHPRLAVVCRGGAGENGRREGLFLLPRDEDELVGLFSEATEADATPAPTLAVVGGRGGAGASLLTVALALAGERAGLRTALLDTDPLGCGADVYLGCEGLEQPTGWGDLLHRNGRMRWRDLSARLPSTSHVSVLTWTRGSGGERPLPVGAVRAVLASARSGADLVVADLPRSFDPATQVVLNHADLLFVVIPADVPSVVAATRMADRLREEAPVVRAVVRGAGGELSAEVVAGTLRMPLGADLPPEPGLARTLAAGQAPGRRPRSPLGRFADRVVAALPQPRPVP
ncbi:septum formation initiator [Nocardiopsis kunsanensis]|uniref:Septum formation initiator n=1 Tax=Nocardiopsis kunsanensis TaxID=141693 RepID=A0A918XH46_9ACTN|nr:septum formation initiator [Nocardiopsis kunsanensis]